MERIESAQNERFMTLRRLATEPRTRRALGQCWLEGLRLVEAAVFTGGVAYIGCPSGSGVGTVRIVGGSAV